MVEHHRHVAAQGFLDGHGPLGRNGHQPAVDVGTENGLLLAHLDQMRQAEELEAAAIGEDWPVPAHEPMQPPQGRHGLLARPQGQVVGVRQDHLVARGPKLLDLQPFHAPLRPHRHKGRRLHVAVRGGEDPAVRNRAGIAVEQAEGSGRVLGMTHRKLTTTSFPRASA